MIVNDVDSWRRRISQKVEEVQGLIESSKFESGDLEVDEIQKRTGDGQLVFVLLLSLARQSRDTTRLPDTMRAAAVDLDNAVATALEALANHVSGGSGPTVPELDDPLNTFERSVAGTDAVDKEAAAHLAERLALYRTLVAAVKRLSSESMRTAQDRHEASGFRRRKDADSGAEVTLKESRLARPAKKAPTDAFVAALSETEADLTKTLIAPRSTAATIIPCRYGWTKRR